jgi:hypothetical protein
VPAAQALAKDGPSTRAVHAAIERGAAWLRQRYAGGFEAETWHSTPEIVALTLSHAGVSPKDEVFARALELIEVCELRYTYRVSVLAMALAQINPYRYRARLAHCAQWLVDTQLPGGEWGYPGAVQGREDATRALKVEPPAMPTEEEARERGKEAPLVVTRRSDPASFEGARGDFSNTQFALLGLRACGDARIQVPDATWQAALAYIERFQREDGGWGYVVQGEQDQASYASLTAAGIVGAALCVNGLGKGSPRSHPAVKKGLAWLAKRWDPRENVGIEESTIIGPSTWQTYHLYSIERVGRVLGLEKIGKHDWYAVGAADLLARQAADGSWEDPGGDTTGMRPPYLKTADTCFAILFLTLSTPPLTKGG